MIGQTVSADRIRLCVVVPFRNVGTGLGATIEYFLALTRPPGLTLHMVFVGALSDKGGKNINGVKHGQVSDNVQVELMWSPSSSTNKAVQVEHVWQMLQKSDQMPDYIAIFDADSRPESDTLVLFLAAVRRNRSALLQMPSLYVCNTETLGAFADAVAQSIWTLAFEIPRWLRNEAHTRHIHYVVSHGLFIRVDVLKQYPIPLESNVEDILYGFTLYFHGIVPDVLPAYDVARGPNEMRHCILQKAKWFCGCVYATQAQFNIFRNQVILKPIMRRHLTSLWWLMGYFTILFVFVLMIMTSAITISMVLLIATCFYIFHYCLPAVITIDQLSHAALGSKMPNRIGLICYAISGGVLYYCLYNVGPWFGLLNAIRHLSFLRAANKIGQTQL